MNTIILSVIYCTNFGFIFKDISGSNFKLRNSLISVYFGKILNCLFFIFELTSDTNVLLLSKPDISLFIFLSYNKK